MAVWSHWISNKMPRVGMYIQVVCQSETTGLMSTQEGRVTYGDGTIYCLNGETPNSPGETDLVAVRWRFRVSPQIRELYQVKELEDA